MSHGRGVKEQRNFRDGSPLQVELNTMHNMLNTVHHHYFATSYCQLKFELSILQVTDVRLPRHLEPEHYRVSLIPFIKPDNYTIRGDVAITMKCVESGSNNVTVHIADLGRYSVLL